MEIIYIKLYLYDYLRLCSYYEPDVIVHSCSAMQIMRHENLLYIGTGCSHCQCNIIIQLEVLVGPLWVFINPESETHKK